MVQSQLAEYHADGIENSFVKEDTARLAPASRAEVFATAGKNLRLYDMPVASQERT